MREDPVDVVFIAGAGRSGSTVLDNILGNVDTFVSVGELRYIWERGFVDDRLCGCGLAFSACPFWRQVVRDAFGDPPEVDPRRMTELQQRGTRVRHVPAILRSAGSGSRLLAGMDEYPSMMERLYRSIREVSGARVVVDSSKLPAYGHVVDRLPGVRMRVVHLIRDPRATAWSWLRKKALPDVGDSATMQQQRPLKASALWSVWNWTADRLWSGNADDYLRVRYEDFVRAPKETVEAILRLVGEGGRPTPFTSPTTVRLNATHSVAGNPSRFKTGDIELRVDDEWSREMPARSRAIVKSMTWPLLRRYGYGARS
jgi:hypothetical protein